MTTRHLVDPELLPLLDSLPVMPLSTESLPYVREGLASGFGRELPPTTPDHERMVPGPEGAPDVPVFVYLPRDAPGPYPALLEMHGGGHVAGTALMGDEANRLLADTLGCVVVTVDYRLAPETPFPGPLEDCYAALRWLHANADEFGIDRTRIGVIGESAGGGLAAGLALLARDRGEVPLAYQMLRCPMLDDRSCIDRDPNRSTGEYVWTREGNLFGWTAFLGAEPGGRDISPYAAPARATDLAGLPPTFINIGALDLFLDESLDYARRLVRAGVPVELHVYSGAFHVFELAAQAAVSQRANRDMLDGLDRALNVQR